MMHFDNVLHLFLVVLGITVLRAEIDVAGSQGNKCSMDGIFPDRTDCSRFYMCSAGKKTVFQCPGQLRFNPNLLVCDWPVNVVCLKDIPTKRTSLEPRISGNRASTKSDTQYVATTEEVTSRTAHVSTDPHTVSVAGKDESVYSDVKGANIEHVTDATHTTSINKDKISIYKTKATPATTGKDEIVDRDSEHSRTTPSVDNGTSLEHVSTRETTLLVSTEYATAIPPIGLKTAAIKDESNYVTHVGTSVVTPIETITSTIEENTSTDGIASNVGNVTGKASVTTVKQSAITTGENKAVGQDIAYFSTASLADSGSTSKFVGTEQVTLATEYAANIPHTSFKSSEGKEKPVTSYISQTNEGVTVAIHSETTTTPVKEEETSTHGLPPSTEETDNTATEETATPRTKNVATNEGDMTATPADSTTEQAVSTGKSTLSTENITIVPHTDFKTTAVKEETVLNYIASTNIGNFIVTTTSTKREETTTNDPIQNIGATATTNLYDGADGENVNTATYAETSNFTDHVTTEQATLATDPTTVPHISLITTATKEAPASNGESVTLVNQSEDTNNSDKEETSNDGITNTGITTRETSTIAIESNKSSTPYATTDKNSGYSYTTLSQGTGTTEHEVITKHASLTTEYIITPPHFDLSTTVRTKESVSSDSTITDAEDVKVDTYITATTTSFEEEPLADTLTSDVENIEDVFMSEESETIIGKTVGAEEGRVTIEPIPLSTYDVATTFHTTFSTRKNNAEFVSTDIRSTSVEDVTVTTHSEDATTPAQNVVTTVFLHTDSITTTVTENPVTNDVISTTVNNFTMHTDTTNTPLAKKEYALGSNDETIADEATNSMIDEVIERFNNVETTSMPLEVRLHDKPGDTTDFPSHTENALMDANEIMTADMDRSHEDKVLTVTKSVKMEYIDTNIDVISGDKMLSKANKHTDATYENVAAFKGDSKTGIVTKIPTDDSEIIVKDNKTFIKRLASTTKSIAIVSPVQNKDISLDDGRELSTSAGTEKYVDTTYNTVSPDNTITHKMTHSHLPQDMTNIFDSSASNEVVQQAKAISIEEEIEAALGNLDASGDAVIQGTIATENTSTVIEKPPNEEGTEQEEVVTTKKYTSLVTEEAPSQTAASKNKDVMEDIAVNETDSNRVKANEERTEKLVVEENTAKNTERKAFKKEEETMTKEIDLEVVEESLEHFSSSSVNTMIDESGSSMTENTDKDGDNEEQSTVDKADKGGVVIKEKFVAFNESGKVIIDQGDSDDSTVTEGIVRELSAPVADKTVDRQNLDSVSNIHEDEVIIDKQEIVEENKILTSQEESESDSKVNGVHESSDNEADRQKLINVNHAAMSKNPDIVESTTKTGEVKNVNTLEEKRSGDGNVDTLDIVGKITSVSEGNHYDDDAVEGSSSQKSVALGKEKKIVHGNIEEIAEKTKLEQTVVVTELPIAPNSITEHGESLYDEISSLTGTILNDKADEISTILGKGSKSDVPVTTENKFSSQEIATVVDRERASISKQIIKNDMQDNNEEESVYEREKKLENTIIVDVKETSIEAKVTSKVQKSVESYTIVDEIAELENPQRDVSATMSNISKEQSDNAIDKRWSLVHRNSTNPSDTIPESDNGDINIGTDKSDNELKVADVEKSTKLKKTVKVGVAETNKRVFYDDKYPEIDITDVIEKQSETKNIKQQLNENPTDTIRTSFEKEAVSLEDKENIGTILPKPKNVEDIESIETILPKPEDVLTIADGKNSKLLTTINTKNNAESETIESVFEDNLNDISAVGSRRKSGDSNVGGILNVEEVKTDKIVDEILDSTGNARIVNEDVLNGTKHQAAIQDSVSIDSTESRKFNIQDIRDIASIRSGNTASEENILPDTVASTDQYEEKYIVVVNGFVEKNKDETANVTGKYFENVQKDKLDKISGEIFRENMENAKVNTLADNIVQIAEKVKKNQTVETNAHITNITPVKKGIPATIIHEELENSENVRIFETEDPVNNVFSEEPSAVVGNELDKFKAHLADEESFRMEKPTMTADITNSQDDKYISPIEKPINRSGMKNTSLMNSTHTVSKSYEESVRVTTDRKDAAITGQGSIITAMKDVKPPDSDKEISMSTIGHSATGKTDNLNDSRTSLTDNSQKSGIVGDNIVRIDNSAYRPMQRIESNLNDKNPNIGSEKGTTQNIVLAVSDVNINTDESDGKTKLETRISTKERNILGSGSTQDNKNTENTVQQTSSSSASQNNDLKDRQEHLSDNAGSLNRENFSNDKIIPSSKNVVQGKSTTPSIVNSQNTREESTSYVMETSSASSNVITQSNHNHDIWSTKAYITSFNTRLTEKNKYEFEHNQNDHNDDFSHNGDRATSLSKITKTGEQIETSVSNSVLTASGSRIPPDIKGSWEDILGKWDALDSKDTQHEMKKAYSKEEYEKKKNELNMLLKEKPEKTPIPSSKESDEFSTGERNSSEEKSLKRKSNKDNKKENKTKDKDKHSSCKDEEQVFSKDVQSSNKNSAVKRDKTVRGINGSSNGANVISPSLNIATMLDKSSELNSEYASASTESNLSAGFKNSLENILDKWDDMSSKERIETQHKMKKAYSKDAYKKKKHELKKLLKQKKKQELTSSSEESDSIETKRSSSEVKNSKIKSNKKDDKKEKKKKDGDGNSTLDEGKQLATNSDTYILGSNKNSAAADNQFSRVDSGSTNYATVISLQNSFEDILDKWDDMSSKERKEMQHKMKKAYSKDAYRKKKHELKMLLKQKKKQELSSSFEESDSIETKKSSSEVKNSKNKSNKKDDKKEKKKKEGDGISTLGEDKQLATNSELSLEDIMDKWDNMSSKERKQIHKMKKVYLKEEKKKKKHEEKEKKEEQKLIASSVESDDSSDKNSSKEKSSKKKSDKRENKKEKKKTSEGNDSTESYEQDRDEDCRNHNRHSRNRRRCRRRSDRNNSNSRRAGNSKEEE